MQHGDELVSRIANQGIAEPQLSPDKLGSPSQDLIAYVVAVCIVDLLESVQVHHHDHEWRAVPFSAALLLLKEAIHISRVGKSGQIIGEGRFLRSLERQRIVYGSSGMAGNGLEEPDLIC